jgi:class 3 adenylate cyclase
MPTPEGQKSPLGDRRLAAILFTDVANFSGLVEQDEKRTLTLVQRDLKLISELCQRGGGDVLKNTGDGVLTAFSSVEAAVATAIKIQRLVAHESHRLPPEQILHHRIGIHLGDVYFGGGDVLGNGVNLAARLMAEAEPDGICISQTVYDLVKHRRDVHAVNIGPRELKHIREAVQAYRLVTKAVSDDQNEQAAAAAAAAKKPTASKAAPAGQRLLIGAGIFCVIAACAVVSYIFSRNAKSTAPSAVAAAVAPPITPAAAPAPSAPVPTAPVPAAAIPATDPVTALPPVPLILQQKPDFHFDSPESWSRFRIYTNEILATKIQDSTFVMTVQSNASRVYPTAVPLAPLRDATAQAVGRVHGAEPAWWGMQLAAVEGPRRLVRVTISLRGLVKVDLSRLKGSDPANNPLNPNDFYLFHNPSIHAGDELNSLVLDVHNHQMRALVNGNRVGGVWDINSLGAGNLSLFVEGGHGAEADFERLNVWRQRPAGESSPNSAARPDAQ